MVPIPSWYAWRMVPRLPWHTSRASLFRDSCTLSCRINLPPVGVVDRVNHAEQVLVFAIRSYSAKTPARRVSGTGPGEGIGST
jgi:hypothetical protein